MMTLARLMLVVAVLSALWSVPFSQSMLTRARPRPLPKFRWEEIVRQRLRLKKLARHGP